MYFFTVREILEEENILSAILIIKLLGYSTCGILVEEFSNIFS